MVSPKSKNAPVNSGPLHGLLQPVPHGFVGEDPQRLAPENTAALHRELKASITVASYFKPMCADGSATPRGGKGNSIASLPQHGGTVMIGGATGYIVSHFTLWGMRWNLYATTKHQQKKTVAFK